MYICDTGGSVNNKNHLYVNIFFFVIIENVLRKTRKSATVVSDYVNTIKTTFYLNFYLYQSVKQHKNT